MKKQYKGKYVTPIGCPEETLITSSLIEEAVNQPFHNFQGKLNAIKDLDIFIGKSVWLGKVRAREDDSHISYISKAEIEGERCYLIFVRHKGTPIKFHSISEADMEKYLEEKKDK